MVHTKNHSLLYLCIIFVLGVAGCVADSQQKEEAVQYARTDNTVIIRQIGPPDRLNPALTVNGYARQAWERMFQYLLSIDIETLELIPQLANSRPTVQEITEGPYAGTTAYTFEIHEEASWDNGSPITADDYIFSLKAVFNPKVSAQPYRSYITNIKDVEVDEANPKRFTVYTKEKYILDEAAIAGAIPVMPAYIYDAGNLLKDIPLADLLNAEKAAALAESEPKLQEFADQFGSPKFDRSPEGVVGSGPYKLDSWNDNGEITMVKKENWWGDKVSGNLESLQAYPDRIIFKATSADVAALSALRNEEFDVVTSVPAEDFDKMKTDKYITDRYNLKVVDQMNYFFIYINTNDPLLSDKQIRKALALATNPAEIIDVVYNGYGTPIAGPVPPFFDYMNKDLALVTYNPDQAKAVLKEAGWEDTNGNGIVDKTINGTLTELTVNYGISEGREVSEQIALLVQNSMKQAGIDLVIDKKDFRTLMQESRSGNYQLVQSGKGLAATPWDPKQDWHTSNIPSGNRPGFGTAETDALIEKIRSTLDKPQRDQYLKELQAIIYEEQPMVFLFTLPDRVALHKRFDVQTTLVRPGFMPEFFKKKS